jgi:hypothetical protein
MFRELDQTLELRKQAVEFFWDEIDWDLFEVVKTGTDRLQHYLFDAMKTRAISAIHRRSPITRRLRSSFNSAGRFFTRARAGIKREKDFLCSLIMASDRWPVKYILIPF